MSINSIHASTALVMHDALPVPRRSRAQWSYVKPETDGQVLSKAIPVLRILSRALH